jgi:hypothetical protein
MPPQRIMYIEKKSGDDFGPARIGRVTFSKTGRSIYYDGKTFRSLKGRGIQGNYYDVTTGEEYWISGPHRDGGDSLFGYRPTPIDADAREEYWTLIRKRPGRKDQETT